MKRLAVILFATTFVFLAAAELPPLLGSDLGIAEARRCPRGYRKVCGRKKNCRKQYVRCKRYRRGRCVNRVYRQTCVRRCRCVRR